MATKEQLRTVLEKNKAADKKLVLESLALIVQMEKLGAGSYHQGRLSPPYAPTIRAVQPGDRS
jgi:hypothetical protein